MRDQEIKDLSTTIEHYENLSAKRWCTQDEQDNLEMAEYILLKSVKPLLEEVRKLKEENQRLRETYESNGMMILKEGSE